MLQSFPPQYLYQQFYDDPNLQAIVASYNAFAQAYLNAMTALNLPVYTNLPTVSQTVTLDQNGTYDSVLNNTAPLNEGFTALAGTNDLAGLLEWVLTNLYGIPRPSLGEVTSRKVVGCAYNTVPYNSRYFIQNTLTQTFSFAPCNDDIYKRVATWNLYRGDGYQFTARWLKRRVARFLTGTGGVDPIVQQTYAVGVEFFPNYQIQINCNGGADGAAFIPALSQLLASGALYVPFLYTFTVNTV